MTGSFEVNKSYYEESDHIYSKRFEESDPWEQGFKIMAVFGPYVAKKNVVDISPSPTFTTNSDQRIGYSIRNIVLIEVNKTLIQYLLTPNVSPVF